MFVESTALLIILTPLFVPLMNQLGVDLIQFGVIMELNLTIGTITPPFGTSQFICCSLLDLPLAKYARAIVPFLIAEICVLLLISVFPVFTTLLPNLLL